MPTTLPSFQVLDRHLRIHQNYLLEASAGTGKTFSIQNIVVRLLLESDPLRIEEILIVTFTRAATRELKQRIRNHIEQSLSDLTSAIQGKPLRETIPDYLMACIEEGMESMESSKRRLQQALFTFDRASIFTIHGFCSRMLREYSLESNIGLQSVHHETSYPTHEIHKIIRDFFRTELFSKKYSPGQLSIILQHDSDQSQLLRELKRGYEFENYPAFPELFAHFKDSLKKLKLAQNLSSAYMLADFQSQAAFFRKNPKTKENKEEILERVKRFVTLFDHSDWTVSDFDNALENGSAWIESLEPELQKKPHSTPLHYPNLTNDLKNTLEPIIHLGSHFPILLARLTQDCLNLLKQHQKNTEKLFPDDFLKRMIEAINNPDFLLKVRSRYRAALIDEFQDTDPIQWNIFQHLFLPLDKSWKGYLYLVGDPKQSIYSFRQADIYTYLTAANAMGSDCCYSLDTNYRSHPFLIDALNTLFQSVSDLIPLPKKKTCLPYHPVKPASDSNQSPLPDSMGALHFFVGNANDCTKSTLYQLEEEVFFPFICKEIIQLSEYGLPLDSFTVLVRDRYQALRLTKYFDQKKLPSLSQRGFSLAESPLLNPFIAILQVVLNPQDLSSLKSALGSILIGASPSFIRNSCSFEQQISRLMALNKTWNEQGFAIFIDQLLNSCLGESEETILEHLLHLENGNELCIDLHQIIDHLLEAYNHQWIPPEQIIRFLDDHFIWQSTDDEKTRTHRDPSQKGINIITLHYSKGLEFEVVFALGLINPVNRREIFIPIEQDSKTLLSANPPHESTLAYLHEIDAEKMRQLYVAMTRAKSRLYVPIALHLSEECLPGEASPVDLFLKGWKSSSTHPDFFVFLDQIGKSHHMTYSLEKPYSSDIQPFAMSSQESEHHPIPPPQFKLSLFPETLHSFTRITSSSPSGLCPPNNFENPEKTIYTLPAGRETGILIHQILEKISFNTVKNFTAPEYLIPYLHPFVQQTRFESWVSVIAELVYYAIKNPLFHRFEEAQCYRELPFFFPFQSKQTHFLRDTTLSEGHIKGVIDLIFIHDGLYYVLDWKTSWLGPSKEDYSKEKLVHTMRNENYHLQASFYAEALKRYLSLVDQRPFEECFGGIVYCFLRGIHEESHNGFFTFNPLFDNPRKGS